MSKKSQAATEQGKETKKHTPTFLLELPLQVNESQAARLRAHLEAGRQFYNAVLSEGQKRLRQMRADPAWQQARAIPRAHKQERARAFSTLREQYGFSEYALHEAGKQLRVSWIAEHLDAVLAQTLAISLLPHTRQAESVEGRLRTPAALARGAFRYCSSPTYYV
jgi:hypothetical protein